MSATGGPSEVISPAAAAGLCFAQAGLRVGPYDDPDRYELVDLRSRGGEGELWRSVLPIEGVPLPVAVKVINEANNERLADWSRRWKQQAEILRTFDHPSLVKVREAFEGPLPHPPGAADSASRSLFLVMNWVKGESLVEWVAHNPDRDLLDSIRVISRIADAVDYLHGGTSTGKAVLHRDIKPANVLIDGAKVCLVDFGFARFMSGEPMTLAGTPYYLAPEVIGGGIFSEASDRYALGATAYYAIVGEPPTPFDNAGMRTKLANARGAEGRIDLADHVLAMMAQAPAQRPVNAIEWAQALAAGAVSMSMPTQRLATAAAGISAKPATQPSSKRKTRRGKLVPVLAGLAVLVVIGAIAGVAYAFVGKKDPGTTTTTALASIAPDSSTTTTEIATTTTTTLTTTTTTSDTYPSTTGATDGGSTAATSEDGLVHMNLSQLAKSVSGDFQAGQVTMKTKPYFYSVYIGLQGYDRDQPTRALEYNVPRGFDTFRATIGMDDTSGSTAKTTFQVLDPISGNYLFGGPGHVVTLKVNEVRVIEVKLPPDILRVKLVSISSGSYADWWDVGITPAWGDAEFSGQVGTAVLPPAPTN